MHGEYPLCHTRHFAIFSMLHLKLFLEKRKKIYFRALMAEKHTREDRLLLSGAVPIVTSEENIHLQV